MNGIILASILCCSYMPDGTLLFLENSNDIVANETNSSLTHIAVVMNEGNTPYVYEATPPRVRKILLSEYFLEIEKRKKRHKKIGLHIRIPKNKFSKQQITNTKQYLESELGRKYGIGSYLSGKPKKRIHCGELTIYALRYLGVIVQGNPCTHVPASIYNAVNEHYEKLFRII